jgi:hypothetical protein
MWYTFALDGRGLFLRQASSMWHGRAREDGQWVAAAWLRGPGGAGPGEVGLEATGIGVCGTQQTFWLYLRPSKVEGTQRLVGWKGKRSVCGRLLPCSGLQAAR